MVDERVGMQRSDLPVGLLTQHIKSTIIRVLLLRSVHLFIFEHSPAPAQGADVCVIGHFIF